MPEIIPNLHPIFVHFTVALLSLAVGLFVVTPFVKPPLKEQWQIVARWALWFGAGFTIITGFAGLDAYNTVAHDTPSHLAMTDHRNWAVATIVLFLGLAAWSIIWVRKGKTLGPVFVVCMVVAGGVLAATAWRGGEVVYRYGLGVMSLPKSDGEGHSHSHGDGGGHGSDHAATPGEKTMDFSGMDEMLESDGHGHEH
ncbi:MAG: DUF2231 domain-containing protein [Gammaproteobacteria bacterium]|nr:DUF2231 domain-containing protein [Gammaproteobacteria bacterium]